MLDRREGRLGKAHKALMTHLLIGWRAGDLIVINGRGPAWPAPQRSVVPVSPRLSCVQAGGNVCFLEPSSVNKLLNLSTIQNLAS